MDTNTNVNAAAPKPAAGKPATGKPAKTAAPTAPKNDVALAGIKLEARNAFDLCRTGEKTLDSGEQMLAHAIYLLFASNLLEDDKRVYNLTHLQEIGANACDKKPVRTSNQKLATDRAQRVSCVNAVISTLALDKVATRNEVEWTTKESEANDQRVTSVEACRKAVKIAAVLQYAHEVTKCGIEYDMRTKYWKVGRNIYKVNGYNFVLSDPSDPKTYLLNNANRFKLGRKTKNRSGGQSDEFKDVRTSTKALLDLWTAKERKPQNKKVPKLIDALGGVQLALKPAETIGASEAKTLVQVLNACLAWVDIHPQQAQQAYRNLEGVPLENIDKRQLFKSAKQEKEEALKLKGAEEIVEDGKTKAKEAPKPESNGTVPPSNGDAKDKVA